MIEQLIFFYVLQHKDLANKFRAEFFNNKYLERLFKVLKPYVLEYGSIPSLSQTLQLVKDSQLEEFLPDDVVNEIWKHLPKVEEYDGSWLKKQVMAFGEHQNDLYMLRKVLTFHKENESWMNADNEHEFHKQFVAMINSELAKYSFDEESKTPDVSDPECFDLFQFPEVSSWTTGYKFFDKCLDGGWSPGTLHVLMGPPKSGKSKWLCNLAAQSMKCGNHSAYITLELDYRQVYRRIISNSINIKIKGNEAEWKDKGLISERLRELTKAQGGIGKLMIRQFPTSTLSVKDLELFLLELESKLSTDEEPFKFRNVFVDYLNIMADSRSNIKSDDSYSKIKNISEDLRAIAVRNNWCIVTATQTNRSGFDKDDLTMANISESSALVATCDSLFGIIQTSMMYQEHRYSIKALALRNAEGRDLTQDFKEDPSYLRITESSDTLTIPEQNSFSMGGLSMISELPVE